MVGTPCQAPLFSALYSQVAKSKLEEKLLENKCRIEHEELIQRLPPNLKEIFSNSERTSRRDAISNLAASTWVNGNLTTTRGGIAGWSREEFSTFEAAISKFVKISFSEDTSGWLTFSFEGMHYELKWKQLKENIFAISRLLKCATG